MSSTALNLAAAAIALPILGFGVAPHIFVTTETPPSVFCDQTEGAPAELNHQPAIVFRLCDSPYLIVVPGIAKVPIPSPVPDTAEEPQFFNSPAIPPPASNDGPY